MYLISPDISFSVTQYDLNYCVKDENAYSSELEMRAWFTDYLIFTCPEFNRLFFMA